MKITRQACTLLASCISALGAPAALAQVGGIEFAPVDLHFETVHPSLPTVTGVGQLTLFGVEYRNTTDEDGSSSITPGDTARIDGVFTVTSMTSGGKLVNPPGMNITWEMTGTYVALQDTIEAISSPGTFSFSTSEQVGILTLYVSTDMSKRGSVLTGLGYDDGTMVAQFAVHESEGVYTILAPFDGSRDLIMLKQSGLAGFFAPEINGATFDSNLDSDPDNNGIGGNAPVPSAWPYPNVGVNFPFAYFSEIDGSLRPGNIVDFGQCRMTGGSVDVNGNILIGTPASGEDDRYQTGGQIGAPTAALPQPFGEWTHHQQTGTDGRFTFHSGTASAPAGTEILSVECSEPGYCQPARPAPFKRIRWEGIGTFKNIDSPTITENCTVRTDGSGDPTLHYYRALVEDIGEPGAGGVQLKKKSCNHVIGSSITPNECDSCPDTYQIEVHCTTDPNSPVIYSVGGFINGGNFQIHPAIGEQPTTTTTKGKNK